MTSEFSSLQVLRLMAQLLYDKKGLNILALDVRGLSPLADYLLICEGNVERHVSALAQSLIEEIKGVGGPPLLHMEGVRDGDWVVLDYGEIVVHIFVPFLRDKYRLERLWPESHLVDLEIDFEKKIVGDFGDHSL